MTTDESLEELLSRSRSYAGIGSRLTPATALVVMEGTAAMLAQRGLTLRSGGAQGADMAFEYGCHQANGKKEIFLPWKRFNGNASPLVSPPKEADELAALCHPNWKACDRIARRFHARNCQQVLGEHLDDPVDFVLFWARERDGVVQGGTATAIYLARNQRIPTFNLFCPNTMRRWRVFVESHLGRSLRATSHPLSFINRVMRTQPRRDEHSPQDNNLT